MKTNFINSNLSNKKQTDKVVIEVRISLITFFELSLDISSKKVRFILLNMGLECTW
jgi:hypothetical protein